MGHEPVGSQKADIFTKPLSQVEFSRQISIIQVHYVKPHGPGECETRKRLPDEQKPVGQKQIPGSKPAHDLMVT